MLGVNIKFSDGNTIQNSFFNKKVVFYNKTNVERSEIVGLNIFRSNIQVSIIFITYILLKCHLKMSSQKLLIL